MLRDLANPDVQAERATAPGVARGAGIGRARRRRPWLLIVHRGDPRLAMLEGVLTDLGYHTAVVACPEEAVAAMDRGAVPDVLLTAGGPGTGFARDCLARWPGLRALYIAFVPVAPPPAPGARESLLMAPFNAEQLESALATLWPASRAR